MWRIKKSFINLCTVKVKVLDFGSLIKRGNQKPMVTIVQKCRYQIIKNTKFQLKLKQKKKSLHQNNQENMGLGYFSAKKSLHQNNQEYMDFGNFGATHLYNPFHFLKCSIFKLLLILFLRDNWDSSVFYLETV